MCIPLKMLILDSRNNKINQFIGGEKEIHCKEWERKQWQEANCETFLIN